MDFQYELIISYLLENFTAFFDFWFFKLSPNTIRNVNSLNCSRNIENLGNLIHPMGPSKNPNFHNIWPRSRCISLNLTEKKSKVVFTYILIWLSKVKWPKKLFAVQNHHNFERKKGLPSCWNSQKNYHNNAKYKNM